MKCFYKDRQAFAHFLKKADYVLDAQEGSDICQMSQGRVVFTSGANQRTCMRLTPQRMAMPFVLLRAVVLLLLWKLRGDSKRSAFFNPATNELGAAPRILSPAERAALALLVAGASIPSVTQALAQRQPVKP